MAGSAQKNRENRLKRKKTPLKNSSERLLCGKMLDDRSYMKSSPLERRPVTVMLIVVLVAIYLIQVFLPLFFKGFSVIDWFGLSLGRGDIDLGLRGHGIKQWYLWQLFTFQFLHEAPMPFHVLFNCLGLYFFGRAVEDVLGRAGFLRLYFLCGFFGGVVYLAATWILRLPDASVVGASAGVMGLLAAYATLFPMRDVTIFVFIFPVTLRAKYLFWGALVLSAYGTVVPFGNIAHAAHLGGILMGLAYIRWGVQAQNSFNWRPFQTRQRKRELVKAASVKVTKWSRPKNKSLDELPPEEFISREVDPILDKISAHGIQSLTPRERQILEAARAKMEKR